MSEEPSPRAIGGTLRPGLTVITNTAEKPEYVLTREQFEAIRP